MRPPIFIVSKDDVLPFRTPEAAAAHLKPADAQANKYTVFDSLGQRLNLAIVDNRVVIQPGDPAAFDPASLKRHLVRALTALKYDRAALEKRHLKELVRFASNYFV